MSTPLRLLLAEDNEDDAWLLMRELRKAGYDVMCERVDTPVSFRDALEREEWDVVVSDFNFPRFSGNEALRIFKESGLDLPFIFVSGAIGEDAAVEAMKAGANDYVMKNNLARLGPAIERELREARERQRGHIAEEAMRTSEYKYRHLFESMSDAAFLIETQSARIIDCNVRAEKLTGLSRSEILGRTQAEFLLGVEHFSTNGGREKMPEDCEARVVRGGMQTPVLASGSRIELYGRQCLLMLFRDITSRKQLEEKLMQAQKLEAIGLLAGGIAHDFNNLLSIIQLQTSLLASRPDLDAATRVSVGEILAATKRAGNLTRKLLAVGRREVHEARDIDLGEIVEGMICVLRRSLGEQISLESEIDAELPMVHADPGMMEQVLMNLVINARDAMPEGGRIVIKMDVVEIGSDYVSSHPNAKSGWHVRLSVTDSGCGIPPENLRRVFEPFFTTKPEGKGSGLGLATVFGIVRQHGGWVEAASTVGKGTTFQVFLSALQAPLRKTSRGEKEAMPQGRGETILLVEDEDMLRILARTVLERCGYEVLEAVTAADALEHWASHSGRIDLLLTDCVLPGGTSGLDLMETLRKDDPNLRMIYTSGYSHDVICDHLRAEGGEFLKKPYSARVLAQIVRSCLDRPPSSGQLTEEPISSKA
jgi:PAS domain S-box-containing protein